MSRSDPVTSKMWSHVSYVVALAIGCGACQHANDPVRKDTAASAQPAAGGRGDREPKAAAAGPHDVGALAPVMALKTLDGDTIDLAKLYGAKPVYLKFWATWCIPCREQMPKFKRIYDAI